MDANRFTQMSYLKHQNNKWMRTGSGRDATFSGTAIGGG